MNKYKSLSSCTIETNFTNINILCTMYYVLHSEGYCKRSDRELSRTPTLVVRGFVDQRWFVDDALVALGYGAGYRRVEFARRLNTLQSSAFVW